jgi:3-dehydroquinate dehydratase I
MCKFAHSLAVCHRDSIPIVVVREMASYLPKTAAVVGTIHSASALHEALRLKPGEVDLLELRVDHFMSDPSALRRALPKLRFPLIVTVRHPAEGGAAKLGGKERSELYREFLRAAAMIDVELRSAKTLRAVLDEAAEAGVSRILSWHDFRRTPKRPELEQRWEEAKRFSPEVIKFATRTASAAHLGVLLDFLTSRPRRPAASVMGMKEFGKISRLTLGAAGSVLNYGYLGELQVLGQWPARVLKERLRELELK